MPRFAQRADLIALGVPDLDGARRFSVSFADPTGSCWQVARNPGWSVAPDGAVTIGDVES
jgi:hypothetical protein